MSSHTRNITLAYIQAKTPLERNVYIAPPEDMGIPSTEELEVVKLPYGILESGLYWYLPYTDDHTDQLDMRIARADPFLLFKYENGHLEGMVLLQGDASFIVGA